MQPLSNNYAALEAGLCRWMATGGAGFEDWILKVYHFQRENNPVYRAFCQDFPAPSHWREIPAVPVSAFKSAEIRSFPEACTVRTFETSGTTGGQPGRHHFCSLSLYLQASTRGWIWAGLPPGPLITLIPHTSEARQSSLSQMASWLGLPEKFFFNRKDALFAALDKSPRSVLFGTALAFLDFFEWMGDRKLVLPAGSIAVETGGYKGTRREMPKSELYRLFQERLGLPPNLVWNEYGMTELTSQFYTSGLGRPHLSPPWARGLVVNPATGVEVKDGETGILRIFDAANLGSACAVQTRDLAIRRGRDFELLGRDPAALPRGCSLTADELLS